MPDENDLTDHKTTKIGWIGTLVRLWRGQGGERSGLGLTLPLSKPRRKSGLLLRALVSILAAGGAIVLIGLAALSFLTIRLSQGPLELDMLTPRIVSALDQRFDGAYQFTLAKASLARGEDGFILALQGMAVRDASGHAIVAAPEAQLSVDSWSLLIGQVVPRRLEIVGADLRLSVLPDGNIAISAGTTGADAIALATTIPALANAQDNEALGTPNAGAEGRATKSFAAPDIERLAGALRALVTAATQPNSPLGALDRMSIRRGRLIIDDAKLHHQATFEGVDLTLNKQAGSASLKLAADGPAGRWSATADVTGVIGGNRTLELEIKDLSFDEIALLAGMGAPGIVFDAPISAHLKVAFDAKGQMSQAEGRFLAGAGLFKLDHPDYEPLLFDEVSGAIRIDPVSSRTVLENIQFYAGDTHFGGDGSIEPPIAEGDGWHLALSAKPGGNFGAERPGEQPIVLEEAEFSGQLQPVAQKLVINRFALHGAKVNFDMSGLVQWGILPHLSLSAVSGATDLRVMTRLWPSTVAAPVRAWFLQHVRNGAIDAAKLTLDFDAKTLDLLANEAPLPDAALHIEASLSDAAAAILPDLPPVSGLSGTVVVTGRTASFLAQRGLIDAGGNHRMVLSEGGFKIADTSVKPPLANINVRMAGGLDTVTQLLAAESLKRFANLPLDAKAIKGQIDGRLTIDMALGKPAGTDGTQVKVSATISNFIAEKLIGKEKLEGGTLELVADRSGLRANGQGRMFGAPAIIELKKAAAGNGEATINVILDDAARIKAGFAIPGLTGAVGAHIVAALGNANGVTATVELDLAKAAMDAVVPGLSKAAGRPAKATFKMVSDKAGTILEQIVFDSGLSSFRGSAKFSPDGGFISTKLNQMRLAAGDDMRLDAAKAGDGLHVVMSGTAFDARAILQALLNPAPSTAKDKAGDIELEFKSAKVAGNNKQTLSGVELKLSRKGGQIRKFVVGGHFAAAPFNGAMLPQGPIHFTSDNAGALLAFVDLYRRMEGGDIAVTLDNGSGRTEGKVLIHDFLLRDEPALRSLVSEGTTVRQDRNGTADTSFDATAIEFSKLQVFFTKTGGRIDMREGVMYGPQIGTTLEGVVDFSKNFVDVKGTFVPAYGLNNFFARIPLLGPLLGGGAHEGLFAVKFRISGPATGPTLNINPLSAIAPGFLRNIFGGGEIPSAFQPKALTR